MQTSLHSFGRSREVLKAQVDSIGLLEPSVLSPLGSTRTGPERMLGDASMPWYAKKGRNVQYESVLEAGRSMPSQQRCVYSFDAIHEWP